ncbi:MAG: ubiquitin-like small modifier protein 1 [Promethearchaeota archaeon]
MHVVVRTIGPYTEQFGFQQLTVHFKGRTVHDLLNQLCEERGTKFCNTVFTEEGQLRRYIKVLINGRGLHVLEGLDTPLTDGDVVALFPPVAGGAY